MKPGDPRLELLYRYTAGLATREDVEALEQAIVGDAEFRELTIEYLHLDSALEEFGVESDLPPVVKPRHRVRWALAAAAAVLVAGIGLLFLHLAMLAPAGVEVEVLPLADGAISGLDGMFHGRDRVRLGALALAHGEARFRLPSKAVIELSGLTGIRFLDSAHVELDQGKMTVDCEQGGRGFIVGTRAARVVDVSTQFGVDVRSDGSTDVLVIKGKVELYNSRQGQILTTLTQGEAVRVDARQTLVRLANITGGLRPGEWSTQPPPAECSIASVHDNSGATDGFHFYRIMPQGLKPGVSAYTDRNYVWRTADAQDFPATLVNADLVETYFHGAKQSDYAIEVEVARPVELFVLMPRRGIPAPWLTGSFTPTGEELMLEESRSASHAPSHVPFEVWKRVIPQAGAVVLGPANRDANGNPVGMYGVATKSLSPSTPQNP
jgi:ferric-dicitrate binding protein FerR (iron transport regulator)